MSDNGVLKRFMLEFFPYSQFRKSKIFTKEMRGNYEAQAERICLILGLKTIYEYRAKEVSCHLSYGGKRPEDDKEFITTIPSIYE